jgi:hypothetical protein
MKSFRFPLTLSFSLLLCAFSATTAQENSQGPAQTIRVSVERVNVGAIVTDARGNFVEGLRREDFHVFDNGIEQPLTGFATVEETAQVLFLVESGPAVVFLGKSHFRAADTLLTAFLPATA